MITIFYNRKGTLKFHTFVERAKIKYSKDKSTPQPIIYERVRPRPFFKNVMPHEVWFSAPRTLFLVHTICGISEKGERLDLYDIDFSQVIEFINQIYPKCKNIKIVPTDVVAFDDPLYNIDHIPEFALYNTIVQNTNCPVQLYHYHLLDAEYKTQYADLYAWRFIEDVQQHRGQQTPYTQLSYEDIDTKLNCLNNAARPHRSLITVLTKDFDITLTHRSPLPDLQCQLGPNNKHSILTVLFKDDNITKKFNDNYSSAREQFSADDYWLWDQLRPDRLIDSFELIQKSFCHIVTEEPYFDIRPRVSDKTLKPLYVRRPFLLLGSCYTLSWLRDQGFSTFNKWWDESYDSCEDHQERFEAVYRIAEYINSLSLSDCKQIIKEMKPILEHNANHLSVFQKATYANLLG